MNAKPLKILQLSAKIFFFIGVLLLPLTPMQAAAQTSTPSDDEVNRIAEQLFCPVCENVPLDECQTAACEQWRELIRQKLGEGWKEDEIKAFFVAQYGDRVLGTPPRRGAHWLLYVLPPLVFLIGLVLLFTRLNRGSESRPLGEKEIGDPYLQQVEQDLEDMEGA
jgi:cytochrome c-type biogenesis protein CcmH